VAGNDNQFYFVDSFPWGISVGERAIQKKKGVKFGRKVERSLMVGMVPAVCSGISLRSLAETNYRRTRGPRLTGLSPFARKCVLRTTNTFTSILFLREESSRQRYLDSYLQDNYGDMQYSASTQCVRNSIFPHFIMVIDYDVVWGAKLWFVFCGCVLVR
jgi:hypothetical protein